MQEESRFEDFVGLIGAIDKEIQRIKTAELARFGLRASDLMVVYYLEKNPEGLTGADLARLADVDRAAVSRTVTRLAADGFVEVGEESTRYRAPIRLTDRAAGGRRPHGRAAPGALCLAGVRPGAAEGHRPVR